MRLPYGRPVPDTKGRGTKERAPKGLGTKERGRALGRIALLSAVTLLPGSRMARAAPAQDPPRTVRIMALGDSLTAGYGLPHAEGFVGQLQAALDQAHARAVVLDAGVSGDTSADGLARLDWALGDHPDAAIIELGANDGLRGLDPGRMEHNLSAILDRLRARHVPVLLSGMYAPPNLGAAYGRAFRAVFDRLSQRTGLLYDPFFLAGVAGNHALNQADGLHPLPAGIALVVRRLMPLVLRLVAEARRSEGAAPHPDPAR